jgi:hypothetical protein
MAGTPLELVGAMFQRLPSVVVLTLVLGLGSVVEASPRGKARPSAAPDRVKKAELRHKAADRRSSMARDRSQKTDRRLEASRAAESHSRPSIIRTRARWAANREAIRSEVQAEGYQHNAATRRDLTNRFAAIEKTRATLRGTSPFSPAQRPLRRQLTRELRAAARGLEARGAEQLDAGRSQLSQAAAIRRMAPQSLRAKAKAATLQSEGHRLVNHGQRALRHAETLKAEASGLSKIPPR